MSDEARRRVGRRPAWAKGPGASGSPPPALGQPGARVRTRRATAVIRAPPAAPSSPPGPAPQLTPSAVHRAPDRSPSSHSARLTPRRRHAVPTASSAVDTRTGTRRPASRRRHRRRRASAAPRSATGGHQVSKQHEIDAALEQTDRAAREMPGEDVQPSRSPGPARTRVGRDRARPRRSAARSGVRRDHASAAARARRAAARRRGRAHRRRVARDAARNVLVRHDVGARVQIGLVHGAHERRLRPA